MGKGSRFTNLVFGRGIDGRPPERVLQAIRQQQRSSELLIAIVQFAVIATFSLLYKHSPMAMAMDEYALFTPAPWVIGIYFVFSILRLGLCIKGYMPPWFLAISVIADVLLLLGLIWGFHIQYLQPAGFYLKVPTLFYVFIFIALRALRFDVTYVLLTGLAAAAGWIYLVYYAYTFDSLDSPVAQDYVEYITSNKVLIAGEVDKIIAIVMTTVILALAIVRARRLLVRAVTEGIAAQDLKRFFAPEIAQAITASQAQIQPGQGEVRTAAILHVDIRGFTPLSTQLDPNDLMLLLADYQARMVSVIRRHGGSIDKFLGDGILASFGAARPSETFAADALRAVHDLSKAARLWNEERVAAGQVPIRIGVTVAAGQVVFGAVGDASRLEYTVIGEPVNLAAKLDKQCKVERCLGLASVETFELGKEQGYGPPHDVEIRRGRHVEGVPVPVDLAIIEPES